MTAYLAQGGKLFVSGSEIGWDLDAQSGGAAFFNNTLKADYSANDAGTYSVTAAPGSIFTGLSFSFSSGNQFSSLTSQTYNVDMPDRINPLGGATAALNYSSGTGAAGIQYTDAENGSQIVMLAFPFETITTPANRAAVMDRVIDYFQLTDAPSEIEIVLDNGDGPGVYTETGAWTTSGLTGYNGGDFRFATVGSEATAEWRFTAPFSGQAEVFVQYRATANRATDATYEIDTGNGIALATANQTTNNLEWVSLGTYFFQPGQRTITLNALTSSGGNAVNADAVRIVLTAGTEPDADFDADGQVDGHDFLAWQQGVGAAEPTAEQGDANGDGAIDGDDLAVWQEQYGNMPQLALPASAASVLVEPQALAASNSDANYIPLAQHELSLRSLPLGGDAPIDGTSALSQPVESRAVGSPVPPGLQLTTATGNGGKSLKKSGAEVQVESLDTALGSLRDWSWRDGLR